MVLSHLLKNRSDHSEHNVVIVIGSQKAMFSKTGDDYSGFAEVMPWEDTVMAMNELGTMIDDLQKQGDYAVDKWSR